MKDPEDISIYNQKIQEQWLYQLLTAIDDRFDMVKRDILKREPLPSVEAAYSAIRREAARLHILKPASSGEAETSSGVGIGLAVKEE